MKTLHKRITVILLALLLLSLTACAGGGDEWDTMWNLALGLSDKVDDPQVRAMTEAMLETVIANDAEACKALLIPGVEDSDFEESFSMMHQLVDGMDMYTMVASSVNSNTNFTSDITIRTIQYLVSGGTAALGEKRLIVNAVYSTEYPENLASFYISEYIPVTQTGSLASMRGANGVQWVLLILGLLECGFILWMFVDCACHKVLKKWLWLLLIALGAVALTFSISDNSFHTNFNLGLFFNQYTSLILYSNGASILRLMVPVGAIVYGSSRKRLFAAYEKAKAPQPPVQTAAEPADYSQDLSQAQIPQQAISQPETPVPEETDS